MTAAELAPLLYRREPEVRVVRLGPGLNVKAEAGSDIRRLFAGPFLPGVDSPKALDGLLRGTRDAEGAPTPPLDPSAGGPLRTREFASGVGRKQ